MIVVFRLPQSAGKVSKFRRQRPNGCGESRTEAERQDEQERCETHREAGESRVCEAPMKMPLFYIDDEGSSWTRYAEFGAVEVDHMRMFSRTD